MSSVHAFDSEVTTDIEPTTPTVNDLATLVQARPVDIATRTDGSECGECVYLEREGGYAFRRFSVNNSSTWRFIRTKDFDENFNIFAIADTEAISMALIHALEKSVRATLLAKSYKDQLRTAIRCMGRKTRLRFARRIKIIVD